MTVPEGWKPTTYAQVADINPGSLGKGTPPDLEIEYLDIGSVSGPGKVGSTVRYAFKDAPSRARRAVEAGDTVVSTVRPYLRSFTFLPAPPENLVVSTGFAVLRPLPGIEPSFLYQSVLRDEFVDFLVSRQTGSNYPAVGARDVAEAPVLLPPLPEQRKIGDILSSVDATIEKTEAVIEQLQVVKKAMMQELLTRGIPGRHRRFKETEIGVVPEEWEVVPLGAVATVDTGYAFKSTDFVEPSSASVPIVRMSNLRDGVLNLRNAKHISQDIVRGQEHFKLKAGDFLVGLSGSLSNFAWVREGDLPCYLNQRVGRIRPKEGASPTFVAYSYLSERIQDLVAKQAAGLAQANVSPKSIREFLIAVPEPEEQREIAACFLSVDRRLTAEGIVVEKSRRAKNALMSVLLTGKLRVTPDDPSA